MSACLWVCPSISLHRKKITRFPLEGFSLNLVFRCFFENLQWKFKFLSVCLSACMNVCLPVSLSISLHRKKITLLPLEGFSLILIFGCFFENLPRKFKFLSVFLSACMYVCLPVSLSISLHRKKITRLPLEGFSWNLIFGCFFFRKSAEKIQVSLRSAKNNRCFTRKSMHLYSSICSVLRI